MRANAAAAISQGSMRRSAPARTDRVGRVGGCDRALLAEGRSSTHHTPGWGGCVELAFTGPSRKMAVA